ncbi:MAG: helix-turn-helix domain-containing protein [Phycisphaerae bacterium]|nr:helix-turn-helix domain-containing protein [Phycisphaerae bacterium]
MAATESEQAAHQRIVRPPTTPDGLATRCRAVLLGEQGLTYTQIGARLIIREQTLLKWQRRFLKDRHAGLRDMPRPGAKRTITREHVAGVASETLEEKPPDGTHWSLRSMAAASGVSPPRAHTFWKAFNLQPHRVETFKMSKGPALVEKVRDIVGLYISPPENAVVICCDKKSQKQALDRTQPLLSLRPGTPARLPSPPGVPQHHRRGGEGHRGRRRCGVSISVALSEKAALAYLDARSESAARFTSTADANTILGMVTRNRATISKSGH